MNWTENGTAVSSDATYSFTVTADRDLVANFSETQQTYYTINVTANPTNGGIVTGANSYVEGATATLTATANEGYVFTNWTKNGTVVSTDATYTFTVTEAGDYVANFAAVVSETITFATEWTWWSINLNITLDDLKAALVAAAPGTVITIQSQTQTTSYNPANDRWSGGLQSISPSMMYIVDISEGTTITLSGVAVNPADCIITLNNGTNWIGYPVSQSMSLDEAFAGASPVNGDMVSSYNGSSMYYNGVWYGKVQTLEPGQGYIYTSNASDNKLLVFPSNSQK